MSAHAGDMCMSQCKHWRIHLFSFSVPRKEKENAVKSPLSRCTAKIRFAQIAGPVILSEAKDLDNHRLCGPEILRRSALRVTGMVAMVHRVKIDYLYQTW